MSDYKMIFQTRYLEAISKTPQHELITECLERYDKTGIKDLEEKELDEFIKELNSKEGK